MKTMTCKQMGGPCDEPIHGSTPDEMIQNGSNHVTVLAQSGDVAHQEVLKMMEETMTNPQANEAWNKTFMETYDSLMEDQA